MAEQTVCLSVPAEASFARTVRMMASNLAVVCDMSVDEVEDVRMAAEEGFVLCCATEPPTCDITFSLGEGTIRMDFALGTSAATDADGSLDLAELLLSAVCDEHKVLDDASALVLVKRSGARHGE